VSNKKAFTFIENLIVIFVITIAVAAIFFVTQINKESAVKSLVVQIKKYDAALNNFTQKYHALPGDVQNTIFYGITETNSDGNGDNIITDTSQKIFSANGEITNFWMHLSQTRMLDENYDGKINNSAKIGSTFPISKVGDKIGIITFGAEGKTFYQIGFLVADAKKIYLTNHALKTEEAFLFDKKFDDGNPQKGIVIAVGGDELNITQNNKCVKFKEYNQENSDPICQLRIDAQ